MVSAPEKHKKMHNIFNIIDQIKGSRVPLWIRYCNLCRMVHLKLHSQSLRSIFFSKYFSKKNFKTVQDVLDFLLENGGRTTNMEIVKHFSRFFQSSAYSQTNKVWFLLFVSMYPFIPVSLYSCIPVSCIPYLRVSLFPVSLYPCIPISLYPFIPVSLYPCIPVSLYLWYLVPSVL